MEQTLGGRLHQLALLADAYEALRRVRASDRRIDGEAESYARSIDILRLRLRSGLQSALGDVK